jgi:hypothetical protein
MWMALLLVRLSLLPYAKSKFHRGQPLVVSFAKTGYQSTRSMLMVMNLYAVKNSKTIILPKQKERTPQICFGVLCFINL